MIRFLRVDLVEERGLGLGVGVGDLVGSGVQPLHFRVLRLFIDGWVGDMKL